MTCVHYNRNAPKLSCNAFPDVIPDPIIYSQVDHRQPYVGDKGIQWEQDPGMPKLDTAMYAWIFGEDKVPATK